MRVGNSTFFLPSLSGCLRDQSAWLCDHSVQCGSDSNGSPLLEPEPSALGMAEVGRVGGGEPAAAGASRNGSSASALRNGGGEDAGEGELDGSELSA
jgi:hypothetical protein